LYLLDAWLPDLDGFELCRQMLGYDSSPDPLASEPEVTKPRAEGAKDEQQAEGNKKNGKRQDEK